ncbi:transposase [Streptomyces sp. NPDC051896]|uniref:transposase n=1 Tax=Streptomyces sp. NPDC051896 TaxID=3155416 RepID=UPI003444074D
MGHRGDLTDAQWERLAPLLPVSNGRCGRWRDHRQMMNGVLYRIRTGVQRPALPERYGPWKTVHERHRPWAGGRNVGAAAPSGAGRGGRGRGHRLGRVRALHLRARSPARGRCPTLAAPRVKGGSSQAVRTARIRAELVALLAEVVREVRRSAAHAGASPQKST